MKKTNVFKRMFFLVLSICLMSGGTALAKPVTAKTAQQDDEWNKLQSIISQYYGEWNDTAYEGLFVPTMPKTALLGNGDLGVTSGGDAESKTFYISKGDFWAYNGSPMPIGGITIQKKSQAAPDPQTTSLAYQKTVTSSGDHPGYPASRAVNGQWAQGYEGWVTPVGNPQWMAVDLGEETTFNRFVVRHDTAARPNETANATQNFELQTSADGSSWTKVYTVTGNHDAISDITLPVPVTTRYVRLYITKGTQETTDDSRQNPRARIGQFELYNNPDLVDQQDVPTLPGQPAGGLTLNKPVTSSGYHADLSPDRAINGAWSANSGYEGWTSGAGYEGQPGPWWMEVNLENPETFNHFVVQHDSAARPGQEENNTKEFQLQARDTTESVWENVYSVVDNTSATTDITLDHSVTAQYVRLYITKGTQGNTDDSRENPRARIGQFELYNGAAPAENGDPAPLGETTKEIDLGQSFDISRYVVRLAQAGNIKVEASEDGSSWQTVDQTSNNANKILDVTPDSFTARYVRVTGDTESNILEVSLFQTPGLNKAKPDGKLHEIQDILNAEVKTDMEIAKTPLSMQTWTSATENVVVTELTSNGDLPIDLQAQVWAKSGNQQLPITATSNETSAIVTRQTTIDSRDTSDAKAHSSKAALATTIIGADGTEISSDNAKGTGDLDFVLKPGQTVYIVTAVGGGGRTYDYQGNLLQAAEPEVQAMNILNGIQNSDGIQSLLNDHQAWWKDFWLTSNVTMDTSDPKLNTLMKYYYAAQYILGSSIREDKVAPGLYSLWHTTDSSQWSSDYHLNYNFIATFYGVNSSNRSWMGVPAIDAILDYADQGVRNAGSTDHLLHIGDGAQGQQVTDFVEAKIAKGDIDATQGIPNAVLYPVSIGPWGMKLERGYSYYGQLLDAIFSSYPLIEYYEYTQDDTFLPTMYDYLKKCIALYEAWLEKEDGQYVLYSAYNEGSWGKNSAVELALLKNALTNAINASKTLNVDAEKRAEWQDILEHLAPQPTAQYNGKTIFTLAEKQWSNNQWVDLTDPIPWDGNILPMENVIPGEQIGYYSSAADLQIANNTVQAFVDKGLGDGQNGAWSQYNNFPKIFADAVNVRYPAQQIVDNFSLTIEEQMQKNLTIKDASDFHGAEKSGATEAINDMLLLSDKGVMKVFPNWLNDRDAEFTNLRAKGAFVVSSAYSGDTQKVQYVDVVSESGEPATFASPWTDGITVTDDNGNVIRTSQGTAPNHEEEITYTFDTTTGMKYHITPYEADVPQRDTSAPTWSEGSVLTATNAGKNELTLTWPEAQDNTGVTGYKVYKGADLLAVVPADVNSYDVTELTANTSYTFKVEAGDAADNWSLDGPSVTVTTASNSSNGGNGNNNSNTPVPVTPPLVEEPAPSNAVLTIKAPQPEMDATGTAATTIDSTVFKKAAETSKSISIEVPKKEGANGYAVTLPAEAFAAGDPTRRIEIITELGSINATSDMLNAAETAGKQNVTIFIKKVESDKLDAAVQAEIGNRPAVEINIEVDGAARVWNNPDAPITVSIPYAPTVTELADPEHIIIWYIDEADTMTAIPTGKYDPATGKVTWKTTHLSLYAVGYVNKTFNDINNYVWAKKAIEVMASKGVINGTSAETYTPSTAVKRADFIVLLVKALGLSAKTDENFSDVSQTAYYAEAVAVAKKLGIASGLGNNKFNPEEAISRQDMMTIINSAMTVTKKNLAVGTAADLAAYADQASVSSYASQSIATLIKNGIVVGAGDNINPQGIATRAETAVLIYRIYNH